MKRTLCALLAVALLGVGCGRNKQKSSLGEGKTLTILCGAGIRPAMEPIKAGFEAEYGCNVNVMYAGSGTLLGQLQAGVEADLYLPGDIWFIRQARDKDLVEDHRTLAWFVPVIAVQKGNPKGIKGLEDLAGDDVAVGLGKADACAIGNVSAEVLSAAGLKDKVSADFEAMTVNRLANQVQIKALDAAIIWDATAAQYPNDIETVALEDGNFHAVPMAIGVLKQSAQKELAESFVDFAAGKAGAKRFRKNHYQVPGKSLRIACGSSFRPATEDLARLFEKETGCETFRNYGGSGTVLLQMEESKEGDIYICHDPFAYICVDKGISEKWHTVAHIEPTIAVLKDNPKNVKGLEDLLREDLALGLPHRSRSTRGYILWAMLQKHGMAKAMSKRKFFESRTHDLINQLTLNTIDVAVLWDAPVKAMPEFEAVPIENRFKIDAVTSATTGRTYSIRNVKVTVVRINFSKEPLLAAQFARTCLSEGGRKILEKHRFTIPEMP
ncbi:MAG: molybdate ABC transporter substrate-binding protein [Kiritimatiellia bacterium]|jgi:molybdate transport system substrate-binding protein|nr:molybdate ABC transporter substrate-binding protein [Kiritimatiellia bacterium]MDP6847296.1 molybdate ABC transporter substrate-binding protein [Kiritimatiellia bacterium]